jgi:arylsulfatase
MSAMPGQASAGLGGRNVHIVATVDYRAGDEGVLYKNGNRNSGFSMFVQDGRLVVDYNAFGNHTLAESTVHVPSGVVGLGVRLVRGDNRRGTLTLEFDGNEVGSTELPLYMTMMSSTGPSIGFDHGVSVSERYESPFAWTGDLREVVIEAGQRSRDAAAAEARSEMGRQ